MLLRRLRNVSKEECLVYIVLKLKEGQVQLFHFLLLDISILPFCFFLQPFSKVRQVHKRRSSDALLITERAINRCSSSNTSRY